MKTLEQRRIAAAIAAVAGIGADQIARYVSYVQALPAAIYTNGLGQAIATEIASKEAEHQLLANQVAQWLTGSDASAPYPSDPDASAKTKEASAARRLLTFLATHDERSYLRAQAEALAYLSWLKKLARARSLGLGDAS